MRRATNPTNALWPPAVFDWPAKAPKNEFPLPVVFEFPVAAPTNMFPVPALLITRAPPMWYSVAAFTVLAERVPPAVPSPLMLKFEEFCCAVPFWM